MKETFCLILILIAALSASAQERTIDKAAFDAAYKSSFAGLARNPHRMISSNEFYAGGKLEPKASTKSIHEFLPGRSHSIFESQSLKKETIRIGDKYYTREGNGDWKEDAGAAKPKQMPRSAPDEQQDVQVEYKFLGTEKIDDINVRVYAKTQHRKHFNPTLNRETSSISTTKYWFGDGVWYWKSETITEFNGGERKSHSRSTMIYELVPNLKIEAPFLMF